MTFRDRRRRRRELAAARRAAGVAVDRRGRFVVYPIAESFHAAPVHVLDPSVEDAVLGAAVRRALDTVTDDDTALDAHRDALRELGLSVTELDSSPSVGVYARSKGLELEGWRVDGLPAAGPPSVVPVDVDDALGAEVRTILESLGGAAEIPVGPVGAPFAYKVAWLAIRRGDRDAVADALGLANRAPAEWEAGVERVYAGDVAFVSPRAGDWAFALHLGWLDGPPDLARLSTELATEVQYFATHRVPEAHAWACATSGRVLRSFRYVGESGEAVAFGEPTDVERSLGVDWVVSDGDAPPDVVDFPAEETVLQVAAAWSVDPRTLGRVASEDATGIVGDVS